jgi:hypothetical protein
MPVGYQLDPQAGFVHTRCVGAVTFDEVAAHFRELENDPALPASLDVLLDLSGTSSLPESAQLRSVAGEIGRLEPRVAWGRCAIVAESDVLFGMSRMLEVFSEQQFRQTRVFRKQADAEAWLRSGGRPVP